MKKVFQVEYAGHAVRYSFLYPYTRYDFRDYIRPAEGEEYDIRVWPELIELGRKLLPEDSADHYVEYRCLIPLTARALLKWNASIFHAASFVMGGYAWLVTAPSGTGKTTQYFNWQRLFPGEITMISGDMPVLTPQEDGSILVSGTSWNGKENIGSKLSAPLGGVVLLEQAGENTLSPMEPKDCILPFFNQFIVRPETEDEIRSLALLMEKLLTVAPVWKLRNKGDDESTKLLRGLFMERLAALKGGSDG